MAQRYLYRARLLGRNLSSLLPNPRSKIGIHPVCLDASPAVD